MKNEAKIGLFLYLVYLSCVSMVTGSAWLQDPPSRSAAWYYQIKAPVNYNFRNLDCGGVPVNINSDGSRNCGLCGDPVSDPQPRPNENGGKYAQNIIRTRYFESGQEAEISIWNNLPGSPGFYEFRLCDDGLNPSQSCLDRHLLFIKDSNSTSMPVPQTQGLTMVHVQLPVGVTCDYCLLQWRFRKDNSVSGCDVNTKWCGIGRGPQIEYYNCADVTIGGRGQPKPSYIQDPVYTAADYGSAYDVSTTLTTGGGGINTPPPSGGLDGRTSSATTQVPFFTIPTLPPALPGTPGITTSSPAGTPTTERLVFDANGNQIGTTLLGGTSSNSNGNSRSLLLLLGLLPLIGAAALRNNNNPPPVVFPGQTGGFVYGTPPLSAYYLGTSPGFGNFGPGGFPVATGGVVGTPIAFTPGLAAPVGGFQPNFVVAPPGRFGRSVAEIPAQGQSIISANNADFQFTPGISGSGQIVNTLPASDNLNAFRDLVFENGQLIDTPGQSGRITHVQPRSVKDTDVAMDTIDQHEDEKLNHRSRRQSGSEYGQSDSGSEYGESHQGGATWGHRSVNNGNLANVLPPSPSPNSFRGWNNRPRSGLTSTGARRLMVNRRLRNGQRQLTQRLPQNQVSNTISTIRQRQFGSESSKGDFASDFKDFTGALPRRQAIMARQNALTRRFFKNRIPSAHEWYLRLMAKPQITKTEIS